MKTYKTLILGATLLSAFLIGSAVQADSTQDMYRLYNPNSGEHFYTSNVNEKSNLIRYGWKDEGIGWTAPTSGDAVYRLYNPNSGDHHYTLSTKERDHLAKVGWKKEGIGWYSDVSKSVPLYRLYNPYAKTASHHYTTNKSEQRSLTVLGWKDEGIGWYGVNKTAVNNNTGSNNGSNNNHTSNGNTNVNTGSNTSGGNTNTNNGNTNNSNTSKPPVTDNNDKIDKSGQLDEKKIARLYFDLVNQERERVGVRKLIWDDKLAEAAQIRAKEMTVKFAHERLDGSSPLTVMSEVGITNMQMSGEAGSQARPPFSNEQEVANMFFQRQKASAPHYRIMINPKHVYNAIGVAQDYLYFMCDIFAI